MSFFNWVASVFDVARMEMITHCGLERRQKNKQDQDLKEGDNGFLPDGDTIIMSFVEIESDGREHWKIA